MSLWRRSDMTARVFTTKIEKLVFENPQTGVRYLLVKPSDVAIYVEHHAADV